MVESFDDDGLLVDPFPVPAPAEETVAESEADVVGDAVGTGVGAVGDGLVAAVDVLVVAEAAGEVLVARTSEGAKGGCPVVPEMLVGPYTQASTLPGGGW